MPIAVGAGVTAVIIGVVLALGGKGGKVASPSGPASPSAAPPGGLTLQAQAFSVTLSWMAPSGGTPPKSYYIYRDGLLIIAVQAPATSYTDASVVPGKTYVYAVESHAGDTLSGRVMATATTPIPSLSAARLDGTFSVVAKVLSKSGFTTYPSPFTLGWKFTPKCGTGACNVTWEDLGSKTLKATFKRVGAKYSGADSGYFGGKCGSTKATSALTISFKVTKAKAFAGEWVVSKFTGTLLENGAAQLGCVATSATISITGTLAG